MTPENSEALDVAAAAVVMHVCPETLRRLIKRGELRAVKIGRVWRVRRQDVNALLSGELP